MSSPKYRKGDLVMVDVAGTVLEFEILSPLVGRGMKEHDELCYEAKEVTRGEMRMITEDQILRLATPVDNAAELFSKSQRKK